MEATIGWPEGKPYEIAWGEFSGEGSRWSDERVDGEETVGNSLGRAPRGRSDTGVATGWTEGTPWEIASGELRWEGAIRE